MNNQAFHDMLKADGALVFDLLRLVTRRHSTHLQSCSKGCPRLLGHSLRRTLELEPDIETDEEDAYLDKIEYEEHDSMQLV